MLETVTMKVLKLTTCLLMTTWLSGCYSSIPNTSPCPWPENWTLFGPLPADTPVSVIKKLHDSKSIPENISVAGKDYRRIAAKTQNTKIDFAKIFYPKMTKFKPKLEGTMVFGAAEINLREPTNYTIGASADWWMQWFVDGKLVYSTIPRGNIAWKYSIVDHQINLDLKAGKHQISFLVKSGSHGWKLFAAGGDLYQQLAPKAQLNKDKEDLKRLKRSHSYQTIVAQADKNRRMKLVIYGSSVAKGYGAKNYYGWGARLKEALEKRGGWQVVNKSVGGDTTTRLLARFQTDLLPEKPDMVIIGLSLANEGLKGGRPEKVYLQYRRNMRKIIQLCHKHNIVPVITNCYPNSTYTDKHYRFIKNFNAELGRWNIPSIDFLGVVDDGSGKWNKIAVKDPSHPNDIGHREMFYAIPVSMFDFMIDKNYKLPDSGDGWLQCTAGDKTAVLEYKPEYPLHSFSTTFNFICRKLPENSAAIMGVENNKLLINAQGKIVYHSNSGKTLTFKHKIKPDQQAVIGVCHDFLEETTRLYFNNKLQGTVKESISPTVFYLGGSKNSGTCLSEYRNFLLYRTCLRQDQLAELSAGKISHSSLELYAPLSDATPATKIFLENLAPTQAAFKVVDPDSLKMRR